MGINIAVQWMNTILLLGLLIGPFILIYFFIKSLRKKNEENESMEVRMALLEKRVRDLEKYIEESE